MTLGNLTADRARRLELPAGTTGALIIDVDPSGTAARARPAGRRRHPAGQPQKVDVGGAMRGPELQKIKSGGTAMLLIWRAKPGDLRHR